MIKNLNEDTALKFKSISPEEKSKKGILGRLYGNVASFAAPTRNGRRYDQSLWEKLFNSDLIKERFANGGIFGQLCHPDYEEVDMEKIACVMPEPPVKDSKGNLVAYVDLIDTPCGRIAYQLAKYGYKFGISSRGTGDIIYDNDGNEVVDPDTYQLNAFDLVEIPAVESARLAFVESLDTKKKYGKTLKQKLSEELDNASEEDKKIMNETLKDLNIHLNEDTRTVNEDVEYIGIDDYTDATVYKSNGKYFTDYRGKHYSADELDELRDLIAVAKDNDEYNWSDLDEKLIDVPESDMNEIKEKLYDLGFDIEKEGETLFGNTHLQLRLRGGDWNAEDLKMMADKLYNLTNSYEDIPITYNIGLDDKFNITCGMDIHKKSVPNDVEEELKDEDGWGETIPDNLEHTFEELESLMYEIRNARRGAYAGFGNKVSDLVDELNRLSDQLSTDADTIEINQDKLNETVNENCSDKDEDHKTSEEAVNDGDDLVNELQEALLKSAQLEKDNLSLQEQLSVCNAKEIKLNEELSRYKKVAASLSESVKNINNLKDELDIAADKLNEKDKLLESNKSSIKNLCKHNKLLEDDVIELRNSLSDMDNLKSHINELNDKINDSENKLKESMSSLSKYKHSYNKLKSLYVKSQAAAYGLDELEVKNHLNESYSIRDIESVCNQLSEQKANMSKLPFKINEGLKINIKQGGSNYVSRNLTDDDVISESLLRMLDN